MLIAEPRGGRFRRSASLATAPSLRNYFGEPPRNRTENPQIKSLFGDSKTLEILRILHVRSAKHGTAPPIDGTQTAPQAA
jgi:hypothetical protein